MHRIKKGQYGYIKSQRKMEIIKTVSLFLLSLAIIFVVTGLPERTKIF